MKKGKILLLLILVLLMTIVFTACQSSTKESTTNTGTETKNEAEKTYVMKVGTNSIDSNWVGAGHKKLEQLIEERSNGRIQVEVYYSGQLGDDRRVLEYIRDDTAQFCMTDTTFDIGKLTNNPSWNFADTPGYFKGSEELLYKALDGESFKWLKKDAEDKMPWMIMGTRLIGFYDTGVLDRKIEKVSDFKGLKIRVSETPEYINCFKALGANPTPMAWGEIYTGLQQGTVDGVATLRNLAPTYKFTDYAKYWTELRLTQAVHVAVLNRAWYERLPADLQEIVTTTITEIVAEMREDASEADKAANKDIEAAGAMSIKPSAEFIAEVEETLKPVVEQILSTFDPEYVKLLEADLAK